MMLTDPMFWAIIAALACAVIGLWIDKPCQDATGAERAFHWYLRFSCSVVIVAVIVSEVLA